jgi:hypothetical protein
MSQKLNVIRIAICILAGLWLLPLSTLAQASDCLSSPGESAPGRHWFYWTDKISKQRCWFAKEKAEETKRYRAGDNSSARNQSSGGYEQALPVAPVGRYRGGDSSSLRDQSRGGYEQALPVAPTEAESSVKSWFSSTFPTWDGWGSRTEALEPASNEAMLPLKRSGNERKHLKTSQQSKQKPKSQRAHEPQRAKQQAAHKFARVLETAGDKDVPDATVGFEQNWQKVIEAVGRKMFSHPERMSKIGKKLCTKNSWYGGPSRSSSVMRIEAQEIQIAIEHLRAYE